MTDINKKLIRNYNQLSAKTQQKINEVKLIVAMAENNQKEIMKQVALMGSR